MNTLPYEPPPILLLLFYKYSYLSMKINYLCLDKGTEGKHKLYYLQWESNKNINLEIKCNSQK